MSPSPPTPRCWLAWPYEGFVQAVIDAVSSWGHVQRALFCSGLPWPPALTVFVSVFQDRPWALEGKRCDGDVSFAGDSTPLTHPRTLTSRWWVSVPTTIHCTKNPLWWQPRATQGMLPNTLLPGPLWPASWESQQHRGGNFSENKY